MTHRESKKEFNKQQNKDKKKDVIHADEMQKHKSKGVIREE